MRNHKRYLNTKTHGRTTSLLWVKIIYRQDKSIATNSASRTFFTASNCLSGRRCNLSIISRIANARSSSASSLPNNTLSAVTDNASHSLNSTGSDNPAVPHSIAEICLSPKSRISASCCCVSPACSRISFTFRPTARLSGFFFSHSNAPSMPAGVMFRAESADMCAGCGDDSNHCPRLIGDGDFIETGAPPVL